MRNLTLPILGAATLALLSGVASAADLPSRRMAPMAPPPIPVFTWTGFYFGVNVGAAFDHSRGPNTFALPNGSVTNSGGTDGVLSLNNRESNSAFTTGGQIGYNYQFTPGSGVVLGAEADIQYINFRNNNGTQGNASFAPTGGAVLNNGVAFTNPAAGVAVNSSGSMDYYGTVRGRLGYAFDRFFVFGTGGFAYGARGNTGYVYGGGLEYAFTNNFSVRGEFMRVNLRDSNVTYAANYDAAANVVTITTRGGRNDFNVARAALNYKFDFFQPAPVVARY